MEELINEDNVQYLHKQCEFSRINSRIVQRFFRRRQAASSLLRKTIVRASDYGIEVLDLSNMSLPAYQLGLTSFDEPVMYTFFDSYEARKQTYIDFGWPLILKPLEETLAKFAFFYKKESTILYCYYCGVGVTDWLLPEESGDITYYPVIKHAISNLDCPLVKSYYGQTLFHNAYLAYDVKHRTSHLRDFLQRSGAAVSEIDKYYDDYNQMINKEKKVEKSSGSILTYIDVVSHKELQSKKRKADPSCESGQQIDYEVVSRKELPSKKCKADPSCESAQQKKIDDLNQKVMQLESEILCGICLKERKNICFTPCGHTFGCATCFRTSSLGIRKNMACYVCRRDVNGHIRMFL